MEVGFPPNVIFDSLLDRMGVPMEREVGGKMKEDGVPYKDSMIWPEPLAGDKWGAKVARLPVRGSGFVGGPDAGEVVPGEFISREAAIQAGKKYVDHKHTQ